MLHSPWSMQNYLALGKAAAKMISASEHREHLQLSDSWKITCGLWGTKKGNATLWSALQGYSTPTGSVPCLQVGLCPLGECCKSINHHFDKTPQSKVPLLLKVPFILLGMCPAEPAANKLGFVFRNLVCSKSGSIFRNLVWKAYGDGNQGEGYHTVCAGCYQTTE